MPTDALHPVRHHRRPGARAVGLIAMLAVALLLHLSGEASSRAYVGAHAAPGSATAMSGPAHDLGPHPGAASHTQLLAGHLDGAPAACGEARGPVSPTAKLPVPGLLAVAPPMATQASVDRALGKSPPSHGPDLVRDLGVQRV